MKKIVFVMPVAILLLVLISIPAFATPPDDASGHWTYLPRGNEVIKEAGGNLFLWTVEDSILSGTIEGQAVDQGKVILHRSGSLSFNGVVSFESATVHGKTGSLELRVNGTKPDSSPDSDWKGYWVISSAGGDLAGLKGQGTWFGKGWQGNPLEWGHLDYEGNIHFK